MPAIRTLHPGAAPDRRQCSHARRTRYRRAGGQPRHARDADGPAVRRYLAEFLSDPRVVAIPALLWQPMLRGLILPLRSGRSAAKYAQVWLPDGSPLMVHTRQLAEAMQSLLPTLKVRHAMRYGEPALAGELDRLAAEGARRIVVLPLYPQYSTTTTASVEDRVDAWQRRNPGVTVSLVRDYSVDPGWVEAVAGSIRRYWEQHGRGQKLMFSFHGIPQRLADAGDPYPQLCGQRAGHRPRTGPGQGRLADGLPVALRPRALAAAVCRTQPVGAGRIRREADRCGLPRIRHRLPGNAGRGRAGLHRNAGRARRNDALHSLPQRRSGARARWRGWPCPRWHESATV